jgi:adenylylsulfate kinase-like enzyme
MDANLGARSSTSRTDGSTQITRVGYVAGKLAAHGVAALVTSVSPYRDARDRVRASVPNFVEVFVDAPLATCAERDHTGVYAKAIAGDATGVVGMTKPYEPPLAPELAIRTDVVGVEEAAERVISLLEFRGLVASVEQVYSQEEEDEVAARLEALGYLG